MNTKIIVLDPIIIIFKELETSLIVFKFQLMTIIIFITLMVFFKMLRLEKVSNSPIILIDLVIVRDLPIVIAIDLIIAIVMDFLIAIAMDLLIVMDLVIVIDLVIAIAMNLLKVMELLIIKQ